MVARVSMIIPFNEGFRRIRNNNNNNNNYSLNRSSTNVQPLSRVINPHESIKLSSNPQQQQQYAREIRRDMMRARFTMHNLYGVATAGCSSCGS